MKKNVFILFITFLLAACQITERIEIHENGSVSYSTELQFTDMMAMMFDENTKDSLRNIGQFPIDTVMSFYEMEQFNMTSDSISEAERTFMKSMEKMKLNIVMNEDVGKIGIGFDEKNVHAFNAYFEQINNAIEKMQKDDPNGAKELTQTGLLNPIKIKYDDKHFERISINNFKSMAEQMDDSTLASTRQMLGMFTYKIEYKFPKKIKSTTLENALLSTDGKTILIEFPGTHLLDDNATNNFKVEFE